jgi:hypothetical protein
MAKAGEFVNRKGVYPPVPNADKIQFVEMDDIGEKVYAEKRKRISQAVSKVVAGPIEPPFDHLDGLIDSAEETSYDLGKHSL